MGLHQRLTELIDRGDDHSNDELLFPYKYKLKHYSWAIHLTYTKKHSILYTRQWCSLKILYHELVKII